MSWGWQPSTPQLADWAVPRISLMVPESSLAEDQCCICQAMLKLSSKVVFSTVLNVFYFFLPRGGSLRALVVRAEAEGTASVWACLFWTVRFTEILRPLRSPVALAMSSPTFVKQTQGQWMDQSLNAKIPLWLRLNSAGMQCMFFSDKFHYISLLVP